jgi:hypothetical protein
LANVSVVKQIIYFGTEGLEIRNEKCSVGIRKESL